MLRYKKGLKNGNKLTIENFQIMHHKKQP